MRVWGLGVRGLGFRGLGRGSRGGCVLIAVLLVEPSASFGLGSSFQAESLDFPESHQNVKAPIIYIRDIPYLRVLGSLVYFSGIVLWFCSVRIQSL